jgi:hypothetical protein
MKLSAAAICWWSGAISPMTFVWETPDTPPTGGVIRGRDAVLEQ